jgi:hypothetical protein
MCLLLRFTLPPIALILVSVMRSFSQDVPVDLHPPVGERELFTTHAKGDQIYVCKNVDSQYAWTLKAPDASLFDEHGQRILKHYAGPTWEANDGSTVVGKVAASAASPDHQSIPWLLLSAVKHSGSGVMSGVLSIQRLNTNGGAAPSGGCDAAHVGSETRSNYTADYHFYGAGQ